MVRMGRKRRKVVKVFKKTLPKILSCPVCGNISLVVDRVSDDIAKIKCGTCKLSYEYPAAKTKESIDVYNEFVDKINRGDIKL
jgi:transcription elongation factor Elf1